MNLKRLIRIVFSLGLSSVVEENPVLSIDNLVFTYPIGSEALRGSAEKLVRMQSATKSPIVLSSHCQGFIYLITLLRGF